MRRSQEPGLWALFSAGGMLAALVLPVLVAVLWIAAPLGWVELPTYADLRALIGHPVTRLVLFSVVSLALFHWAHRFRYTLYDGLQLYHLNQLIAIFTYGTATVGTMVTGYALVVFP